MKRLLQIEFIKLWNSRSSKILIGIYFVLLCLITLIAAIKFDIGPIKFHLAEQGIFNFPYIWHLNTYVAATLKIFLAVVIVSMMANEYSYKTIKQNLIDGLSKKEFVLSKFLTVVVFAAISTVFITVITFVLGMVYSDFKTFSIITTDIDYLFAYFIKLVGFFAFCLFLGMIVKRSAFALGFLFVWQIIEGISYGVAGKYIFSDIDNAHTLMKFFPLNAMSNLIKEPATRFDAVQAVANQVGESLAKDYSTHWYEYAIVIIWTFLFIYGAYATLKRRDL